MPFPKDWWKNWENAVNHGFKSFNSPNSMGLNSNCSWKLQFIFIKKRYGTALNLKLNIEAVTFCPLVLNSDLKKIKTWYAGYSYLEEKNSANTACI